MRIARSYNSEGKITTVELVNESKRAPLLLCDFIRYLAQGQSITVMDDLHGVLYKGPSESLMSDCWCNEIDYILSSPSAGHITVVLKNRFLEE